MASFNVPCGAAPAIEGLKSRIPDRTKIIPANFQLLFPFIPALLFLKLQLSCAYIFFLGLKKSLVASKPLPMQIPLKAFYDFLPFAIVVCVDL